MKIRLRVCAMALFVGTAWLVPWPALAGGTSRAGAATASTNHSAEAVNINTATVKDLMTLDGIGHKVAEKIVEYREAHGPFKKPEEVRKVQGVGAGLWERNRDRIVVK